LDVSVTLLIWLSAALFHWVFGKYPHNRFFIEQDPFLSYPLEKGWANGEEVPNELVIALAVPVSMVLLFLFQLLAKKILQHVEHSELHPKALNAFVLQLAFVEALGLTLAATEFIKPFAGRKRPNFFALCDYHGYRNAVLTNNFTEYLSLTHPGMPGDISNCMASDREIREAQFSFPSGHSSSIWCGMTFLAIYTIYIFHHYSPKNSMAKGLGLLPFLLTATLVSITRTRDYWHNFDDILGGALIGFASATLAFALNYSSVVASNYQKTMAVELEEASLLDSENPTPHKGGNV